MKAKKLIIGAMLILTSVVGLTGCQKQPVAGFTADKSLYYSGETINLTNTSTDASTSVWTIIDGTVNITKYDKNIKVILGTYSTQTNMVIKLSVASENGKKTDEASLDLTIMP